MVNFQNIILFSFMISFYVLVHSFFSLVFFLMLLYVPNSFTAVFRIQRMSLGLFQPISQLHVSLYCFSLYSRPNQLLHSIPVPNYLDTEFLLVMPGWSSSSSNNLGQILNEPPKTHLTCNIQIKDNICFNLILKIAENESM